MSELALALGLGPLGLVVCGRRSPAGAPNPPVYFPVFAAGDTGSAGEKRDNNRRLVNLVFLFGYISFEFVSDEQRNTEIIFTEIFAVLKYPFREKGYLDSFVARITCM